MQNAVTHHRAPVVPGWRDVVWPKEHGSWSLALEPLALGLIAAPSSAGVALTVAAVAGFFARRPLRLAVADPKPERRLAGLRALAVLGAIALLALTVALAIGGLRTGAWLLPSALAGAVFLYFDLQQSGREQAAEVAGAFAFAGLSAAFGALAGWPAESAGALGIVMMARSVPTVLVIRASVRARKTGEYRSAVPLLASLTALGAVMLLCHSALAPCIAALLVGVLAARAVVLLGYPRPSVRASSLGIAEAVFGVAYVAVVGVAWPL